MTQNLIEWTKCDNTDIVDIFILDLIELYHDSKIKKMYCDRKIYIKDNRLMISSIGKIKMLKSNILKTIFRKIINTCDYDVYDYILTKYIRKKIDIDVIHEVINIDINIKKIREVSF